MKKELAVLTLLVMPRILSAQNGFAPVTPTDPTPKCPITECPDQYMPHGMVDPPAETKKAIVGVLKQIQGARKAEKDAKTDLMDAEALYQAAVRESKAPLSDRAMKDIKEFSDSPNKIQALIDLMESKDPTAAAAANYLQAKEKADNATAQTKALYQDAIDRTATAYHLKPPVLDPAQDPAFPRGTRKLAGWSVEYNDREVSEGQKNEQLAKRNAILAAKGLQVAQAHAAITDPKTGKSYIFREGFEDPDKLAAMILHETRHWVDAVARGGVSPGHGELTAYDGFRTEQNAFKAEADFLEQILQWKKTNPMLQGARQTAKVYNDQAETLKRDHAKGWTKLQLRLDPRYKNFIGIESNAEYGDVPLPSGPARLEPLKDGADHDFIGSYVGDATPVLTEAKQFQDQVDRERQALEAARQAAQAELERQREAAAEQQRQIQQIQEQEREAQVYSDEKAIQEAQRCGFNASNYPGRSPRLPVHIWTNITFKNGTVSTYGYDVQSWDMDAIRTSLLFMRTCINTAVLGRSDMPPCNDELPRMNQRWSDPDFRDRDAFNNLPSVVSAVDACRIYLRRNLQAPIDANSLSIVARQAVRSWEAEIKKAEKEAQRPGHGTSPPPAPDPRPGPRQAEPPAPRPAPGPHCWPGNEGGVSCVGPVN